MKKTPFKETSARIEKYLFEMHRAQTKKEIAEGIEITTSFAYTTLRLMEVFNTVQKEKRGRRYYYFLKGVYDDEQISVMLPPERVKSKPRRRSILRSPMISKSKVQENFLEENLSTIRARTISFEGPSALAMIGLQQEMIGLQQEMIEEEILTEELPRELEVEERRVETTIMNEPFATVQYLPKNVRRLTFGQIKYLKEQLKDLDGYEEIKGFRTTFTKLSALEYGRYGSVFYVSIGTNPWDYVQKVTIDPSISDFMFLPNIESKRWSSWNDFLSGLKETKIKYGKEQYDKILDQFIENDHKLVEITVENRKANYVNLILKKRIGERGLEEQVKSSYVKEWVYLEKVD